MSGSSYNSRVEREWMGGELSYHGLDFKDKTETIERYGEKQRVDRFVKERPTSNIDIVKGRVEDMTEFREAYRAKFGRRAATTGSRARISLNSVGEEKQTKKVNSSSGNLNLRSFGDLVDYCSETANQFSARYGRRAKMEKPKKFSMRSNLKTPGPEAKFQGSSEQTDSFTNKPVSKAGNSKPKANIRTFDPEYLKFLKSTSHNR